MTTDIPKDLADALKKSGLDEFFSNYPCSHQREHLKWITEAKRPETRQRRIQKTMQTLLAKRAEKTARAKRAS